MNGDLDHGEVRSGKSRELLLKIAPNRTPKFGNASEML